MTDPVVCPQPPPADRLLALLPAIYRSRDEENGHQLRALLRIIEEQVRVVEDDLDRWYRNWFIETCGDWVVPYIGALVGVRPPAALLGVDPDTAEFRRLVQAAAPRREAANAVAGRRRKGVAAAIEELVANTTGWSARAVEMYQRLVRHQHVRHLRLDRPVSLDVRDTLACDRLGGPFDDAPYRVDVRRNVSDRSRGWHNLPDLSVYLWRLLALPINQAPAFCIDQRDSHYLVNVLAIDTQLFAPASVPATAMHLAGPGDLPQPLRREEFAAAVTEHYGPGRSLQIWRDSLDNPVPADRIVGADLSNWTYRAQAGQVLVDPVLGRIAFPPDDAPDRGVWVSWHYGFSDRMGGGGYPRPVTPVGGRRRYAVGAGGLASITEALAQWRTDKEADPNLHDALIEIVDSSDYTETLGIELDLDERLEVRSAQLQRPVIRLLNQKVNRFDALQVRTSFHDAPPGTSADCPPPGTRRPSLVLDGLVLSGRSIDIRGQIGEVVIRHCTLVPGWELDRQCRPLHGEEPSIELRGTTARLHVERSILGTILVDQDELQGEPLKVDLSDSIVDATDHGMDTLTGPASRPAYVDLTMRRCTVIGGLRAYRLSLGEDSIVTGCLHVARRDVGCLRYSYADRESGSPPRYRCQPDLAAEAAPDGGVLAANRVRPRFTSVRYGTAAYCQLHATCAGAIGTGAQDGAEMGAFHDLFQPQKLTSLNDQLAAFVPIGVDAAVITVT